jgi:molecular chaperone IbpA
MTNYSLQTIDLPTFARHAVGFDRLFNDLNRTWANSRSDNYPPYNIGKLTDTSYVIDVAVAGFGDTDIDVEIKDGVLTVKGEKQEPESEVEWVHKGISSRGFQRTFTLADHVEVKSAIVKDGILRISLEIIVPEEQKPKKIPITYLK